MPVVLITGSNGLVGSEASEFFCKKGFNVIGIDNNMRKKFFGPEASTEWIKTRLQKKYNNYKNIKIDIRSYAKLEKIFKKFKKDIRLIIHCAAQPSHDYAKDYPIDDFDINARATLNLLELTRKYSFKSPFIFMSTNKVYGNNPNKLNFVEKESRWELSKTNKFFKGIDEKLSLDNCIHSFFGVSKIYSDLIVQEYGKNIGLNTCCIRAGCITGPNHSGSKLHGFLSYLVKSAIDENKYTIIGYKGKQVRDNIHSYDLINSFWEFFKKPRKGEVYNIGGGRFSNCSILEAIKLIEKFTKIKIKIKYTEKPRVGDHIWYISNNSKFKQHYPNWKQKYSLIKIIKELVELKK